MERLSAMVANLISDFQAGQFAKIIAQYDFPLALHLENRLVVLNRPADLERYLQDFAKAAEAAQFANILHVIKAVELPRRGRFRAWVEYTHLDPQGRVVARSERIFFCRDAGPRLLIEMLEVTRLPVECLRDWTPEQRMIA